MFSDKELLDAEAGERDLDQSSYCRLGSEHTGRTQGVPAVARELVWVGVTANDASCHHLTEQVAEEPLDLLLRLDHVLAPMEQGRQLSGAVLLSVVADHRVGGEHRLEPLEWLAGRFAQGSETFQMIADLLFVMSLEDGFDVGEVLVERGAPDASGLGDLRHGYREQSVLKDQLPGGTEDRLAHLGAVRVDRLVPKPRHPNMIRDVDAITQCLVARQYVS